MTNPALRWRAVGTCCAQHFSLQNRSFCRPLLHDATVHRNDRAPAGMARRQVAHEVEPDAMCLPTTPARSAFPRPDFDNRSWKREQALDRCRWHVVEELALPDPFGLAAVLAFAIKLRIAERWAALNETVGERKVEDFIAAMTNAQSQAARGNDPELRKRLDRASEMSEP